MRVTRHFEQSPRSCLKQRPTAVSSPCDAQELTLAIDKKTGDYTPLTRFAPGADTRAFGGKSHDYPEEVFIIEGSLYDAAFDRWLTKGDYASCPPGEVLGPFRTDEGCLVLEISYPSQRLSHRR